MSSEIQRYLPMINAVLVALTLSLLNAEQQKGQSSGGDPFDKCVKILKFGQVIEYDEPSKGDATTCLGLLGDERAVPVLAEHLANETDDHLRFQIARALGWVKSPKAVPALEKALQDKNFHVRDASAMALKAIRGKTSTSPKDSAQPTTAQDLIRKFQEDQRAALAKLQEDQRAALNLGKPFLDAGKTYHFVVGQGQGRDLTGKVLEAPSDNWVKVQVRSGDKRVTSWINLAAVSTVALETGEEK
jgi:hypothetical protein